MWFDLFFPNNFYGVQKRLMKRYDGWFKLYSLLHGYKPNCIFCVNYEPDNIDCFTQMLATGEHPFLGKARTGACFHFKPHDKWSLDELRHYSQYFDNHK